MKKLICLTALAVIVLGLPQSAIAQVPYIQIYFDEDLQRTAAIHCPLETPGTQIGTVYIAAHNLGIYMSSIEY